MSKLLFTPGPLNTSTQVRAAMNDDVGSRTGELGTVTARVRAGVLEAAECDAGEFSAVLLQGSGTFAVEAMVTSLLPEGAEVLVICNGEYAERISEMCRAHRIGHSLLRQPAEQPIDLAEVEALLGEMPDVAYILAVHFETALGVRNDVDGLLELAGAHGCQVLVDAMSTFGALPIDFSSPALLAVAASANKCLHGVPGVGFVLARQSALRERAASPGRTLSLDLARQWVELERSGQWRFTPPTHVLLALERALDEFFAGGGRQARWHEYVQRCELLVAGLARLGIHPLLPAGCRAPMITTFLLAPDCPIAVGELHDRLARHGLIIYPTRHQSRSFRVGCMGELGAGAIERLVDATAEIVGAAAAEQARGAG